MTLMMRNPYPSPAEFVRTHLRLRRLQVSQAGELLLLRRISQRWQVEEAERMPGRVEHHPESRGITVGWLKWRNRAPGRERTIHACRYIVDADLEMHHLRLVPGSFWPHGWPIPLVRPECQAHAAGRIAQRDPTRASRLGVEVPSFADLPAKQLAIELRHLVRVDALDRQGSPLDRRGRSVADHVITYSLGATCPTGWRSASATYNQSVDHEMSCLPRGSPTEHPEHDVGGEEICVMYVHLSYSVSISSLLQIRNVSDDARRALKARAAARGESLNAYLLEVISREVARPTVAEVLDRAARRTERATASAVDVLDAARSERDDQLLKRSPSYNTVHLGCRAV